MPNIGQTVYYYPVGHDEQELPFPATVAWVDERGLLNLNASARDGSTFEATGVEFIPKGQPAGQHAQSWATDSLDYYTRPENFTQPVEQPAPVNKPVASEDPPSVKGKGKSPI